MLIEKYYKPYTLENRVISTRSTTATTYSDPIFAKGFIQPIKGDEEVAQGKGGEKATHRLYTYVSVNAKYGDRVTQYGQKYIVLFAGQPKGISSREHHKEIVLGVYE